MKNENLILLKPESWFYENGYLTINLDLFANSLCAIFNEYLDDFYYYQKFCPIVRTNKDRPIWEQGEETKNLAIISPVLYDKNTNGNYNEVKIINKPYPKPQFLEPFTTYSKEYPSIFTSSPIELKEKEFLLYFGNYSLDNVEIYLGNIENKQFIPSNQFKTSIRNEIKYTNPIYPFIEEYIRTIFNYKVINKKPILNQEDMEIILEEFGISRKEHIEKITTILNNIKEKYTKILLNENKVGNVLKLKR